MTNAMAPAGPNNGISPDSQSNRPVGRSQTLAAVLSGMLIAGALAVIIFAAFVAGSVSPLPAPALLTTGQHSHPLVLPAPAPCSKPRRRGCGAVTPAPRAAANPATVIVR
jgi:hypothetical protein